MFKQSFDKYNVIEKGAGTVIVFMVMAVIIGITLIIANLFHTSYTITKAQHILDMQAVWGAERIYESAGNEEIKQVCAHIKNVLENEKISLKNCSLLWSNSLHIPTKIALSAYVETLMANKTITAIAGAKLSADDASSDE